MPKITHYELINGCKSHKTECNVSVTTVSDVKRFKSLVYEKEQVDPGQYDVAFTFEWPASDGFKWNFLLNY